MARERKVPALEPDVVEPLGKATAELRKLYEEVPLTGEQRTRFNDSLHRLTYARQAASEACDVLRILGSQ
jgi:hypothetical protein